MPDNKQIINFENEKIIAFHIGKDRHCMNEGATFYLDCMYTMALYVTVGFSIALETEKRIILLSANGVKINDKKYFIKYCNDQLFAESFWIDNEIWGDEHKTLSIHRNDERFYVHFDKSFWEEKEYFVGHKILSAKKYKKFFVVEFDNWSLRIFPYKLGELKFSTDFFEQLEQAEI
ncbi:MAG: hypothetical protein IKT42_04480 [Clostridia bacterium]|nr:hypothetical protein [Clostridia bacterium]